MFGPGHGHLCLTAEAPADNRATITGDPGPMQTGIPRVESPAGNTHIGEELNRQFVERRPPRAFRPFTAR